MGIELVAYRPSENAIDYSNSFIPNSDGHISFINPRVMECGVQQANCGTGIVTLLCLSNAMAHGPWC